MRLTCFERRERERERHYIKKKRLCLRERLHFQRSISSQFCCFFLKVHPASCVLHSAIQRCGFTSPFCNLQPAFCHHSEVLLILRPAIQRCGLVLCSAIYQRFCLYDGASYKRVLYLRQPISLGLSSMIGACATVLIKNEEHLLTTSTKETLTNQAKVDHAVLTLIMRHTSQLKASRHLRVTQTSLLQCIMQVGEEKADVDVQCLPRTFSLNYMRILPIRCTPTGKKGSDAPT